MDISKLAPWNWFKKEEEREGSTLPIKRKDSQALSHYSHPMSQLHYEIDRLFEDVFRGFGFPSLGIGRGFPRIAQTDWLKPTLDVGATDKEYTISVELPGVDQKDVHLELVSDTLQIKGEKKQDKEERDRDFYRIERSYGSFQRVLSLPEDADRDHISAVFKNGVMKITLPRKALPQIGTKQIEIKTG
ncbi:Hsp20/alpha crystallin family protein [Desulfomonile tiedjei]|uniref:Molecular chaperone (Small heat shock protein) n=1 Tax=Desulfomonile tiedjei (strain ATCC 49306 / DSM 6799 / DCB-1) TaxID=706587 RepID=I4C930_DESTA|nr:molecular chaperone (small heat shock protein) [Desulfomonile tiedjei DSM 6799]